MGAICCCMREDREDYVNLNSAVYRNCMCLHCFVQNVLHVYTSLFRRAEDQHSPSTIQGTGSLTSTTPLDNSLCDMYRSPTRPLPYNADPRYLRLQRDGLVSRREKGSSHLHEETEPLRRAVDANSESLSSGEKWNESTREGGLKESHTNSSMMLATEKPAIGYAHIYSSPEDEDVCPTCLEEYTLENPKINMKCSHHFHLVCIYEWMERSESCPVCGKVMVFDETT